MSIWYFYINMTKFFFFTSMASRQNSEDSYSLVSPTPDLALQSSLLTRVCYSMPMKGSGFLSHVSLWQEMHRKANMCEVGAHGTCVA